MRWSRATRASRATACALTSTRPRIRGRGRARPLPTDPRLRIAPCSFPAFASSTSRASCRGRSARCSSRTWAPRSSRSRTSKRAIRCASRARCATATASTSPRSTATSARSRSTCAAAEGMAVLRKLIATADVVMDNYRPGVMEKMKLSRAELEAIKPDIVSAHITGFGLDGPYRDRPAFDFIAQAMSGFMSVNGAEDQPPTRAAPPIVRPRRRRLCGNGHLRGARAPRAHGQGRGSGDEPGRRHGGEPRVPLRALLRHRRAAAAHGQRPRARGALRAVRREGWAGRHRAVQRHGVLQAARRARPLALARPSRLQHERGSLRAAPCDQRAHQRRDRQAAHRALGRRAERGGRAVRPRDEPARGVRGSAGASPADADHDRPSRARQARRAGLSDQVHERPVRGASPAAGARRGHGRLSCASSDTARRTSRVMHERGIA